MVLTRLHARCVAGSITTRKIVGANLRDGQAEGGSFVAGEVLHAQRGVQQKSQGYVQHSLYICLMLERCAAAAAASAAAAAVAAADCM